MYGTLLICFIVIGWASLLERTNIKWYVAAIGCVLTLPSIQLATFTIAALAEVPYLLDTQLLVVPAIQLPFALLIFYILSRLEDTIVAWCAVVILGIILLFTILPWGLLQMGIML